MKRYFVTGGTSGIGKALVSTFKNEDCELYITTRNKDKADKLIESCGNVCIKFIDIDLMNVETIKDSLQSIRNVPFDGFIHCAGVSPVTTLRKSTLTELDRAMRINFYSFVEILRCLTMFKPKEQLLRVIAVSSVASFRGYSHHQIYSATKAALDGFIRSSSIELSNFNIEINSIRPATVDTPMIEGLKTAWSDDFESYIKKLQPLGLIAPEEVVEQIRFLLDKKGHHITGTSIFINSGVV